MKLALFLLAVLIVAPLSAQNTGIIAPQTPQVTVPARGEVKVTPDRATIQIGVQTRATTASAATVENAKKQRSVIEALRALGLMASQITTTNYNVYPEQRYEQNREPVITGYNVTNTLLIDVPKLSLVGPVIDAVIAKGANMVTSLQFIASNSEIARREAIAIAVKKARADAEAAVHAAGGTLVGLVEINVGAYYPPPNRPMEMMRTAISAQADTPINPGELTVTVDVSTRWSFIPGGR